MAESLAAVVLAAGAGTRLRPLTLLRPKALCPVDNVPLVDWAIERVRTVTADVAVNVHHGRFALESHLAGSVHLSLEDRPGLGTAGALGVLKQWIDERAAIVVNADTWCPGSLADLVEGWDGERVRILAAGSDDRLGPATTIAGALMPWAEIRDLAAQPAGLYEASWQAAARDERLEVMALDRPCIDCGTPEQYLAANLTASGGASVIGPGALVEGTVERSVVWPGGIVRADEHLVDAIRAGDRITVLVRPT